MNFTVCDDLDQNQIPDCWQSAFGLSAELSGRDMDADNDGVSNYEEYLSGTNPMNAESLLKFSAIDTIGTNIAHLQFLASSNSSYTVQMQPSWFAPRWLKLTNILTQPTNQPISLMHTNLYSDYIFYRIVTPRVD